MNASINNDKMHKSANWLPIILVSLLTYFNNETFPSIYFPSLKTIFFVFMIIASVFLYKLIFIDTKLSLQKTIYVITFICLILYTMLINNDYTGGYGKIIMAILIGYMLVHCITLSKFASSYIKVMVVLACYSLLMNYIFRPVAFSMPDIIFPRLYNAAGGLFIDARLCVIYANEDFYRNFGIFREPGVYQVFLNFALIFEMFLIKTKKNYANILILYAAILSTFSPPGYVAGAIIFFCYLFDKNSKYSNNKFNLLIVLFIMAIFSISLFSVSDVFNDQLTQSMNKLVLQESSYQGRTVAIWANLETWIQSPVFGNGITVGTTEAIEAMGRNYEFSTVHNTSTIGELLVVFGALFTLLFLFGLYVLIAVGIQSKLVAGSVFLAIMIAINTQQLIYNELLYVFVLFGMSTKEVVRANPQNNI